MIAAREFFREHLEAGLGALPELDRLAAAWPLICGTAMAAHGDLVAYDDGVLHLQVSDPGWLRQMMASRHQLAAELTRVAGVSVTAIHFERQLTVRG